MSAPLTTTTTSSLIDPKALMSIRNLEMRARVVVEGFWTGIHRSPYHGFSVEFTEYRQYTPGGKNTNLAPPLKRMADIIRKRSLMVLLSDFLAPIERLEAELTTLTAGGHEVILFQILDPAELAFEFAAPMMFEDLESGRTL